MAHYAAAARTDPRGFSGEKRGRPADWTERGPSANTSRRVEPAARHLQRSDIVPALRDTASWESVEAVRMEALAPLLAGILERAPAQLVTSTPKEQDVEKVAKRQKQIDMGKNTVGYTRYLAALRGDGPAPPDFRRGKRPTTPDPTEQMSTRAFASHMKTWRRALHDFDLVEASTARPPPPASASTGAPPHFAARVAGTEEIGVERLSGGKVTAKELPPDPLLRAEFMKLMWG
jgi:hypothetical protein